MNFLLPDDSSKHIAQSEVRGPKRKESRCFLQVHKGFHGAPRDIPTSGTTSSDRKQLISPQVLASYLKRESEKLEQGYTCKVGKLSKLSLTLLPLLPGLVLNLKSVAKWGTNLRLTFDSRKRQTKFKETFDSTQTHPLCEKVESKTPASFDRWLNIYAQPSVKTISQPQQCY